MLKHYRESMKQLKKYVWEETLISEMDNETMENLIIDLRNNPAKNDMSLYTYARDFKTLMYFFMKCEYIPMLKLKVPKVDKQPIETYSDNDLRLLLRKPNIKQCSFTEYKA